MLEKRLRSRYSHRQILLLCDYSFEEYMDISRSLLSLPDSFTDKAYLKEWRRHLEVSTHYTHVLVMVWWWENLNVPSSCTFMPFLIPTVYCKYLL